MRSSNDPLEEFVWARAHKFLRRVAFHEKIEAIDLFPHFARDLFAGGAGVFARERQTGMDRVWVLFLQADEIDHRLAVGLFVERSEEIVFLERANDWIPLLFRIRFE